MGKSSLPLELAFGESLGRNTLRGLDTLQDAQKSNETATFVNDVDDDDDFLLFGHGRRTLCKIPFSNKLQILGEAVGFCRHGRKDQMVW